MALAQGFKVSSASAEHDVPLRTHGRASRSRAIRAPASRVLLAVAPSLYDLR
jgi:hypothetical protein